MADDQLDEVVGRVTNYLDKVRAFVRRDDASEMLDEPEYFATLDHADLRKLLAAYQSVRSERDALREAIEYVVDCDDSKWVEYFKAELAEIARARTGGTE